ncbi:MAG: nucleotidyltransferase domain-containing protein [Deltaproteobacteria bacterium]|nr:nucleotidyltransferase domain-containing protein [Deltaproteobacteria bacterium]
MVPTDRLTAQEQKALKQFKERVSRICGSKGWEMRIFGSRSRFEGNEESDLDILVLLEEYNETKKIKIWDAAYDIFAATDILLSPHVLSFDRFENLKQRERLIAKEIERDGIPI